MPSDSARPPEHLSPATRQRTDRLLPPSDGTERLNLSPAGAGGSDDRGLDLSVRPTRLAEFVGQPKVRDNLQVAIDAALERGEPLDHTIFYGPPGLGKTTLASLIARELGVNLVTTSGPVIEKPGDLVGTLTNLRAGDVLFIDEIHRLKPTIEEFLYPAMEDARIDIRLSDGPKAEVVTMPIERFTLVGATTRFGLLTAPLRARFGLEQRLDYYAVADLEIIVRRSAGLLGIAMDAEGAQQIAARSRGTPRIANRLLRRVRDYAEVRANGCITGDVARASLLMLDVDAAGLDVMDTRLLTTILDHFDGGPVGVSTLAAAVGEDATTIEEVYEPYLVQQGLLQRTPRGRVVTALARRHLGRPAVAGDQPSFL